MRLLNRSKDDREASAMKYIRVALGINLEGYSRRCEIDFRDAAKRTNPA